MEAYFFIKNNKYLTLSLFLSAISILFLIFFPGSMTYDSLQQLEQARLGVYDNWHPPVMAVLWHYLVKVVDGPGLMLVFHMAMLGLSCVILYAWSIKNAFKYSFLYLLIPFLPWVLNFEFVIWKDVSFAYSWILAIALFFLMTNRINAVLLTLAFTFLFYGFLVRHNSFTAGFIVLALIFNLIYKKMSIKVFILLFILNAALFLTIPRIFNSIYDVKEMNPLSLVMFDDLIGIHLQGKPVIGDLIPNKELLELSKCPRLEKSPVTFAMCDAVNQRYHFIQFNEYSKLSSLWLAAVTKYPLEYLYYRTLAFKYLLRSFHEESVNYANYSIFDKPYKFDSIVLNRTENQTVVIKYISLTKKYFDFLFKPFFWILISSVCAILLIRNSYAKLIGAYLFPLSGIAYTFGYFFTTPEADLRYTYFSSICGTISAVMTLNFYFGCKDCRST